METHQLRYFLAVARTRNFSRAAEQCRVAQPSLSQQIRKLEGELGERLFERSTREVSLTPAGELFREHAARVMEEMEEARERVREVSGLLRGRVVLGALPTVAPYFLPARLRAFTKRHPGIEVVVHEDTTAQLVEGVLAKEVDVALLSLPVERAGLAAEEFFDEPLLVALPRRHPLATKARLALDDLENEAFILMKEGHCLAGQALQFCRLNGFAPRVSFRSAQIETVLSFVASGWGVSIVPQMSAVRGVPGLVFRPLPGVTRSIGVVYRSGRPLSGAARALVAHLRTAE
ncbi:LysR family transcriptional regulator [Oleiharenicola sp. Vm1]|uniref:LysR family transcriptional regulator n=1 Tax=Oleiharenicola sp. Vm1 TaxID=3398393 RepID=UPI0039F5BF66